RGAVGRVSRPGLVRGVGQGGGQRGRGAGDGAAGMESARVPEQRVPPDRGAGRVSTRALSLLACLLCAASAAGAQEIDESTGLVRAPGWEQVRANCGGCHSFRLVTQQRADRQTWLDTIRWMQATQNLWEL